MCATGRCPGEAGISLKLWALFFSKRLNLNEGREGFLGSDVTASTTTWFRTFLRRRRKKKKPLLEASYKIFSSSFVIACRSRYFPVGLCFWSLRGLFAQPSHVGSKCEIRATSEPSASAGGRIQPMDTGGARASSSGSWLPQCRARWGRGAQREPPPHFGSSPGLAAGKLALPKPCSVHSHSS